MKKKVLIALGALALGAVTLALSLPTILHRLGLHPVYEGETYDLPGKRALVITLRNTPFQEDHGEEDQSCTKPSRNASNVRCKTSRTFVVGFRPTKPQSLGPRRQADRQGLVLTLRAARLLARL